MVNKKLFAFLIVGIFLFSMASVSATLKDYDTTTRTVHFDKSFLGIKTGEIANVQLITPLNYKVGLGYQKVAEMKVSGFTDYDDFLTGMDFYDTKQDMKQFNREYDLKKKEIIQVIVDDYTCDEQLNINGTIGNNCFVSGNHLENREVWTKLHKVDFKKNDELIIAMFTDVEKGDKVEWVPSFTVNEVRVEEWAEWTADLNTNLVSYWKLNESSGTIVDSLGVNNGTYNGALYSQSGKIGTSIGFDGTDDNIELTNQITYGDYTIAGWINMNNVTSQQLIYNGRSSVSGTAVISIYVQNGEINWIMRSAANTGLVILTSTSSGLSTNNWFYVSFTYKQSTGAMDLKVNDVSKGTDNYTGGTWGTLDYNYLGAERYAANPLSFFFNGEMDEFGIWDSDESSSITQLYNGGTGITYTDTFGTNPTVTAISPADNYTSIISPTTQNFTCYGSDGENFTEMEFYWNGALDQSNSTGLNATNYTFTKSGLTDGSYNWTCIGYDDEAETGTFTTRNYYVDTTPDIQFVSPTPVDTANLTANPTINVTLTETYFDTITFNINGTQTNFTDSTRSYTTGLADGYYSYNVTAWTTTGQSNTTEQRTFSIDSILPNITVTSPIDQDYITINDTLNLNWTATDTNLDTCWYKYNSTNNTVTCNDNTTTFNYVGGQNSLTFYANDTYGNLNSLVHSWVIKVYENNRTINPTSYDTKQETFKINAVGNSTLTSVTLSYNGTDYATTKVGTSYSKILDIPTSKIGNNTVKWKFNYGSEVFNSTNSYQDVIGLVFTLCNATYSDDYLNISFKDEASLLPINATIPTSTFEYYLGSGTVTKSYTYNNASVNNNYLFCANSGLGLSVDPYVQYKQGTDYPQRIWDADVTSYTSTVTDKILYLLSSVDGIYVTFQTINAAQQTIAGVEVTAVRTIEGEDVIVGNSVTDDAGAVTFWLNPDFQHTFTFSKTGYDTFISTFAPTQSAYTLTLTGSSADNNICSREVTNTLTPSDTYIDQNTNYDFEYIITSGYQTLDSFTASLYYGDTTLINTKSSTTGTGGTLSFADVNTTEQSTIYMTYSYSVNGSVCYSNAQTWIIQSTDGRAFSITRLFTDIGLYTEANVLGVKGESGNDNFSQTLIAFFVLVAIAGGVSTKYGVASDMMIMVIILGFITIFSTTGIIPQVQIGNNTMSVYFLPIITTLILLGYAFKEDMF